MKGTINVVDHDIIDCGRLCLNGYVRRHSFDFHANRDAGSVSRHVAPSTRRRRAQRNRGHHLYNIRAIERDTLSVYVREQRWLNDESMLITIKRGWSDEIEPLSVAAVIA